MSKEIAVQATEDTAGNADVGIVAEEAYEPEVLEQEDKDRDIEELEREKIEDEDQEIEEPDDNAERSRLGRKVKYIEDSVGNLQSTLLEKMEYLQNLMYSRSSAAGPEASPEEDDDGIYTRGDLRREITRMKTEEERANSTYNSAYSQVIGKLSSDLSEDEFSEIDREFRTSFNFRHSNDPTADAERNWYKAERAVLRKKLAAPKREIPLKTEKPSAPLGGSGGTKVDTKKTSSIKLDAAAREFIRRTGMSEEKAMRILSKN
jgi:hypothetical protein